MNSQSTAVPQQFSGYQKVVIAMLAFLQFAVIADFMLMSPLGVFIVADLKVTADQFAVAVAAYAFAAGVSAIVTAGFADRFDRKRLLLFFYTGFILGTLWCGLAQSFESLLMARIFTGMFGGVIGSVVLAIATDLFPPQMRGRVMGFIQIAFAASNILGIPFGFYVARYVDWHMPFIALAAISALAGLFIAWKMRPVDEHVKQPQERSAFAHLWHTLTEPRYLLAFVTVTFLATGGFMLMPFSSQFTVHNLGIPSENVALVYLVTGLATVFVGPLVGKASDSWGRLPVFMTGTALTIVMVLIYTHLGVSTLFTVILINVVLFIGIFSRMIPFQALMTQVPSPMQRGSFSAINASLQQLAGGLAAVVSGHIVHIGAQGRIEHYDVAGYVVIGTSLLTVFLLWRLQRGLTPPAPLSR